MWVFEQPDDRFTFYKADAGCSPEDDQRTLYASLRQQAIDSEFLDAVCNGVIVVGKDFDIVSQNYVSRMNMGDLVGQRCYSALENRSAPCEHCPHTHAIEGEHETSMRCAGKAFSLYEVRIYRSEKGTEVIEVYPDMIDRELIIKNLHLYREELELLSSVVEHIRNSIADDFPGTQRC